MVAGELVGKQIGNYEVKQLLGTGGMGEVYLAQHPRIGRKVAIKVLAPHVAVLPRAAQRFEAEAKVISQIDHPNVINLFDFGALEGGRLYYVMELLKGRELEQVIAAKDRFTPEELLPYLVQICRGLQAAHRCGIVHRDLKPQNIFVLDGPELRMKILDFGIAKLMEAEQQGVGLTTTGMVMGTPLFISPEQAAGQSQLIGPHTDVYSLGVILYRMLSGGHPFEETIPSLLAAHHIKTPPPDLREREPSIPAGVSQVVHRCLEKDPARRILSVAAVAVRFAEAIGCPPDPALSREGADDEGWGRDQGGSVGVQVRRQPSETEIAPTLKETAGEVIGGGRRPRSSLGILLGITGLAVVTAGAFLVVRHRLRPAAVSPDPPPPAALRTIHVTIPGLPSICSLVQSGRTQRMSSPCRFQGREGHHARLEVTSADLHPFLKEWRVDGDVRLELAVDSEGRGLVLGDAAGRAPVKTNRPDLTPRPGAKDSGTPDQARRRAKRRRVGKKKSSEKKPSDKKKPPVKKRIGEGTLEVDL